MDAQRHDKGRPTPAVESLLVGVDRSKSSRRALKFSLERARVNGWRVTVVYVVNWSRHAPTTLEDNEQRPLVRKKEIERARSQVLEPLLEWAERKGHLEGIDVPTQVRHGRPSEVLSDLAVNDGHGMIVVGRTGESNLKAAIFGSTPSRLVQHAPVPVVVVP